MLKKIIAVTMVAILILSSTISYAVTNTQAASTWKDVLDELDMIGIIDKAELDLSGKMTREIFSKIIINCTGNNELAQSLAGSTNFPDVSKNSEYCGYINAAVNKGYLSALAVGKFEPKSVLTFAQLTTAMVRALGYTSSDIIGAWPNGYIDKAKSLGITKGYSYKSTDPIPTSTAMTMIGRMLNTNIKKTNSVNTDITLADSAGLLVDQENWIYSEPEVAFNFKPSTKKIGNIKFDLSIPIIRNTVNNTVTPATNVVGETITLEEIEDKNVVYEVYNKLNVLIYYLVVDNTVEGEITSILPNKYSPTSIKINGVSYELGEYAGINKFNSSKGSFNVGDDVSVVLGYDGKVVDAYLTEDENNKDYAFVVKTSTMVSDEAADYGKVYYTVDLLHVDGTTKTYKTLEDPTNYRWRLIRFSYINSQTVALLSLSYITDTGMEIDKYDNKIGQSYTTENIKIFNYTDSTVNLISWDSIPKGILESGRVKFIGTTGNFGDVNVLLTYDVFNEQYKNFVVQKIQEPNGKNVTQYTYTLISGSTQYTYTSKAEIPGAAVGSVFNMKMNNNKISSFNRLKDTDSAGWYFQAIDSKRVKMNNSIYMFGPEVTIYAKDYSGNLTVKNIADIAIGENSQYSSIRLYCDRPLNNGGKVESIIISFN